MPAPHEQDTVRAADPAPRRRRFARPTRDSFRRSIPWLSVLALLLVTAAVLLSRPGGLMQGAETQAVETTGISGPFQAGTTLTQEVTATQDGLAAVSATFGTYGGATDCAIQIAVEDDRGDVLVDRRVECGELADSRPTTIAAFDPIADSEGRTYTVTYAALPGDWTEGVTLWVGTPVGVTEPATAVGDDESMVEVFEDDDTATATIAEYAAPSVWAQLWRAAGLASVGAPWWGQPVAQAVWALVFLGSAVAVVALRRVRRVATVLLVALAVARGLMWSVLMPPLEGMDEGAHISYVEYMAQQKAIPVRGEPLEVAPGPYSEQLTLLNQFQNREAMAPADRAPHEQDAVDALQDELSDASPLTNGQSPAAGYPPVYYAPSAVIYELTPGTLLDKVYAMRLWSVALGGLAAWATMAAARRLFPRGDLTAVLLALGVTVQPMMAHQFAIVNNDALAITAGFAAIAVALKAAAGWVGWRPGIAAGAAVGAALLAKQYGIGALPVVAVGLLIGSLHGTRRLRDLLTSAGGGVIGLAGTYGLWVLVQRIFGFPSTNLPSYPDGDPSRGGWHFLQLQFADGMAPMKTRWAEQLFGTFAWLDVRLPATAYSVVWVVLWVTVVMAVLWLLLIALRAAFRRPLALRDLGPGRDVVTRTALALVAILGTMFALYAAGYLYFRSAGRDELLQGRYALMILPALLAVPALVTESATERLPDRVRRVAPVAVMALLTAGLWVLQVLSFATIADRFYL